MCEEKSVCNSKYDNNPNSVKSEISQNKNSQLIDMWNAFKCKISTSTQEEIYNFKKMISKKEFCDSYPSDKTTQKELPLVSFKKLSNYTIKQNIEGICKLRIEDGGSRTKTLEGHLESALNKISTDKISITSPNTFVLATSNIGRIVHVQETIAKYSKSGKIEWDTIDGLPFDDWNSYGDWKNIYPAQYTRKLHHWQSMVETNNTSSHKTDIPKDCDIPVYRKCDEWKWEKVAIKDRRTRSSTNDKNRDFVKITNTEDAFDHNGFMRTSAWTNVQDSCKENASAYEKQSVYILAVFDDDVPPQWQWQLYVGVAVGSVRERWFGHQLGSHIYNIKTVIAQSQIENAKMPIATLCEFALAHIWIKYGNWIGRVFLFVVQSDLENGKATLLEGDICERYKLTHPRNGLNDTNPTTSQ